MADGVAVSAVSAAAAGAVDGSAEVAPVDVNGRSLPSPVFLNGRELGSLGGRPPPPHGVCGFSARSAQRRRPGERPWETRQPRLLSPAEGAA